MFYDSLLYFISYTISSLSLSLFFFVLYTLRVLSRFALSCSYRTFQVQDPLDTAPAEIGRHYAWRVRGKLDYILERGLFETDSAKLLHVLDEARSELEHVADLIRGNKIDESPYKVDENSEAYKQQMQRRDEMLKLKPSKSKL
jgi:hypothetical protein